MTQTVSGNFFFRARASARVRARSSFVYTKGRLKPPLQFCKLRKDQLSL